MQMCALGGDATENANYEDHRKYSRGVRMGSFCMAIYSISCSIYSFFLQFLMNKFRNSENKTIFISIKINLIALYIILIKEQKMSTYSVS